MPARRYDLRPLRRSITDAMHRFTADERGNIVLIFAVLIVPVLALSIGALDYGRMNGTRERLQHAIDAGLSFAARQIDSDDRDIEATFRGAFKANLDEPLRAALLTFHFDRNAMRLTARASVPVSVNVLGVVNGNRLMAEAEGSLSVARQAPPIAQLRERHPEAARRVEEARAQIDETRARIRAILGRDIDLDAVQLPDGVPQIEPGEAEHMMREVLRQIGR